jgi:hypothetical protein
MEKIDLKPYLNKFITVTLDDGKEESGFIANPDAFRQETDDNAVLVLLNGLLNAEVRVSRIVAVRESVREDTVKIPIVGFDTPAPAAKQEEVPDEIETLLKEDREESASIRELLHDQDVQPESVDAAIDELFEQSLADTMDVDVTTLIPVINDNPDSAE